MLTRREAVAAGVAAITAPVTALTAAAEGKPLKRMYRLENGQWVRRRLSEFQVGNYMKYVNADDPPVYVKVSTQPQWLKEWGEWGCDVIDIKPDDIPKHLLTQG